MTTIWDLWIWYFCCSLTHFIGVHVAYKAEKRMRGPCFYSIHCLSQLMETKCAMVSTGFD